MLEIIPKVNSYKESNEFFVFSNDSIESNPKFIKSISYLKNLMRIDEKSNSRIKFVLDSSLGKEEYILRINKEEIIISASSDRGAFYGVISLRQLLPISVEKNGIKNGDAIETVEIKDEPEFEYRGFMFDVARHFHPKEEVMRMLDLIALYKFNSFHFHISDDQGFRLDIPKYPKLKEISSKRKRSLIKGTLLKNTYVFEEKAYEGCYSESDIEEIIKYADDRFVKVIPEIDVPGHTQAILAAYPEYSCQDAKVEVRDTYGISKTVLCVGNDEAFDFIHDLIKEVARIFHTNQVHIGGDECPTSSYKKCPKCISLMKREGIKDIKKLQAYFTDKLALTLKKDNIKVRVWNEAISEKLLEDVSIQYWMAKKPEVVLNKIKEGSKVVVSPFLNYYLDYTYKLFSLRDTYLFNPYLDELNGEYKENILGVEAPIWTEWVRDRNRLDFQVFPRLIAVSESAWTSPLNKSYDDFLKRLDENLKRLDALDVNYAKKDCYSQETDKKCWAKLAFGKDHPSNTEYYKWNGEMNE